MYVGNYDFWYEYTQMVARQQKDIDKKNEQKIKELQTFIQRFSANASKHKQATSRKKLLDNLQMENYYTPSSRRYPYIAWKPDRDIGNDLLTVTNLSKTVNGRKVLNNISFVLTPGDKVAFVGTDELARTTLFQILMGEMEPDEGSFKWGVTTSRSYFPKDNGKYFDNCEYNLIDWLRQFSQSQYESDIRGWLGRMLFSGEEALKRGVVVYALPIGKVTTVVFVLSIIARFLALTQIADMLLWISVALSMVALIWYAVDLMKKLGIKADSTK